MNVILDTNIIIKDPFLRSDLFPILYRYLKKTESCLLMPSIIKKELPEVYKKNFNKYVDSYTKVIDSLNNYLKEKINTPSFDIDKEVSNFMSNVDLNYKKFNTNYIVDYTSNMVEEALRRAVCKIKPCSEYKEEIKDTLIWLTVLDIAKKQDERNVAFISENTSDFGVEKDKNEKNNKTKNVTIEEGVLHKDLQQDLYSNNVVVKYYTSIESFIKVHAEKIVEKDINFVKKLAEKDNIELMIKKEFDCYFYKNSLEILLERKYEDIDDLEILDLTYLEPDEDFYLYEIEDDYYLLLVYYDAAWDVQFKYLDDFGTFSGYETEDYRQRKYKDRSIGCRIKVYYYLDKNFELYSSKVMEIDDFYYNE